MMALALASCTDESDPDSRGSLSACGKKDPMNELQWIKEEMNYFVGGPDVNAVVLYNYQGMDVLEFQATIFSSTNTHDYNCEGEKLYLNEQFDYQDYKQSRIEKAILYGTKIW